MLVYKFLAASYALDDLAKRRIKISTFSDMNDPFELRGTVSSDPVVQDFVIRHFSPGYGALCFSRKWTNSMLWSHYGDKHRGICLGIEIAGTLEEPRYVKRPSTFDDGALFDAATNRSASAFEEAQRVLYEVLLTKSESWIYEDELRLIMKTDQREGDYYFADFNERIRPSKIVIGARCSVTAGEIETASGGYSPPLAVIQAKLSSTSFEVIEDSRGFKRGKL